MQVYVCTFVLLYKKYGRSDKNQLFNWFYDSICLTLDPVVSRLNV